MTLDDIPEAAYRRKGEPVAEVRERYWNAAFGLQEVDGLSPSDYARSLAQKNVDGELTLHEVGEELNRFYRDVAERVDDRLSTGSTRTEEADKVSQRIVALLENGAFALEPGTLRSIHRFLFADLDDAVYRPGLFKTEALIKPEIVLNGDSVFYAPPEMYDGMLRALFGREAAYNYAFGPRLEGADLANFTWFVAQVWQVHPFWEGNTRTVAVFAELYARDLGFDVDNTPFERHAGYFRDALVRASYRNRAAGVDFDFVPLEGFFDALVNGVEGEQPDDGERPGGGCLEGHRVFDRENLMCRPLFEQPDKLRNVTPEDAAVVRRHLAERGRG